MYWLKPNLSRVRCGKKEDYFDTEHVAMLTGCFDPVVRIVPLLEIVVVSVPSTAVTNREDCRGMVHLSFACLDRLVDWIMMGGRRVLINI